jgi:pimeloyl-ACP methyl ester carboxylesterase
MVDGVVILHGILLGSRCMGRVSGSLQNNDFKVLNLKYPSTKHTIQDLVELIEPKVQDFAQQIDGKLHFVCHSMGGLLARAYLHKYRNHNVGRVVLLGVPNQGSEVADFFAKWRLYKWIFGKAGEELTTKANLSAIIGEPYYEVGAIAGNKTIDPISSYIIGKPNDGKVAVDSALLASTSNHIILPTNHTSMPWNSQVIAQTLYFLQNGAFKSNIT